MKKTLKNELLQIRNLEANIKASSEILEREQERIEELQKECNHDIVTLAEVSVEDSLKAKCLFCGKHLATPNALRELPTSSIVIEASDYKKLQNVSEDSIYDFVSTQAFLMLLKNPNITKEELGEYLKQLFNEN